MTSSFYHLHVQADIKEGDVVAVMPDEEQYAGQPWIAQCLSRPTPENTITVQWFRGSLTRPWVPDRRYDPFDIDLTTIINTVEFTPTYRLTKSSLEVIKDALGNF